MYDVIVIGCGPAGLSAAINVRQRGGSVLVVGTAPDTSPLAKAERIDNYPGLPGLTGAEYVSRLREHAESMGAGLRQERVLNAMRLEDSWMVSAGSEVEQAKMLIFAGGITRGRTYPGEEEFLGRGVSYCATCDGMLYRGRRCVVIGFSDSAREEADYLMGIGCEVEYVQKPRKVEILGETSVKGIRIDGELREAEGVFIMRPSIAPTKLFPELELEDGFVRVNRSMETNLPGLYAAGDCTGHPLQVAKAVGEGLIAGLAAMQAVEELNKTSAV